jgi:flagellar biosynthesis/type III secretory pathway chaperone
MEALRTASDELCLRLSMSLELVCALMALAREKETYLTTGDIENLRTATEKEEELVADLGKLEKDRELYAGALSNAIGFFGKGQSLAELIDGIPDSEMRRRLTTLRSQLKDAITTLTSQNEKLRQLLALQIGYTEYMLNLIYIPKSKNNTYDVQGSRTDNASQLSLFDLHV